MTRSASAVLIALSMATGAGALPESGDTHTFADAVRLRSAEGPSQTCAILDTSHPIKRTVGVGERLYISYAVAPQAPVGIYRFRINIRDGASVTVVDPFIQIEAVPNIIGWKNATFSLDRWAGHNVEISFSAEHGDVNGQNFSPTDQAFWGGFHVGDFRRPPGAMNVIVISLDTLRADRLGCYGNKRDASPNIDRLASEGVRFALAVSQAPWTKPSHASLFTGLYPSKHLVGVMGTSRRLSNTTLTDVLRANGYITQAYTGSGFVSASGGFNRGFDRFIESSPRVFGADSIFESGTRFIEENAGQKFFLFLHTYEIHRPYRHKIFGRDMLDRYDSGVFYTDTQLGTFMNRLRELGLDRNTLVVLVSDHGEDLGTHFRSLEHAHSLYDEVLRVPMIFWAPSRLKPSVIKPSFAARSIDVLPTIADLLGVIPPAGIDGFSLKAILSGGATPKESLVISEATSCGPERKSVRYMDGTKQFKYILAPAVLSKKVGRIPGHGGPRCTPITTFVNEMNGRELYDLRNDPTEQINIAEKRPDLVDKFEGILVDHMGTVGEDSDVPAPEVDNTSVDPDVQEDLRALGY